MPTLTKRILSGSTTGLSILVAATATPGTLIHTAVAGVADMDEIYLYAINTDTVDRKLTLEWGGTTAPNDLIEFTVPGESGLYLIAPGLLLQNGLIVRAFAAAASVVAIHGWVNRITA